MLIFLSSLLTYLVMDLKDDEIRKEVDLTAQDVVESPANTFFLLFFYYSGIFSSKTTLANIFLISIFFSSSNDDNKLMYCNQFSLQSLSKAKVCINSKY